MMIYFAAIFFSIWCLFRLCFLANFRFLKNFGSQPGNQRNRENFMQAYDSYWICVRHEGRYLSTWISGDEKLSHHIKSKTWMIKLTYPSCSCASWWMASWYLPCGSCGSGYGLCDSWTWPSCRLLVTRVLSEISHTWFMQDNMFYLKTLGNQAKYSSQLTLQTLLFIPQVLLDLQKGFVNSFFNPMYIFRQHQI